MSDVTLTADRRTDTGKGPSGRFRRAGRVPAVVYGLGGENVPVTVDAHELQLALARGANTVITLRVDGTEQLTMARQVQRNPLKGSLVHVDFVRVRADQTITADVPLHLEGDAEGVKRGGLLEQLLFSVSVEAKPGDIPAAITHDISALEIGDQLHVRALQVPAGVVVRNDPDELVAQVSAPRGMGAAEEGPEGETAEAEAGGESAGGAGGTEESAGSE
jgi:large subunit ribosomal protein L25